MGSNKSVDESTEAKNLRDIGLAKYRYELISAILQAVTALLYIASSSLALLTVVPLASNVGTVLIIMIPAAMILVAVSIRSTLRIGELGTEKERRTLFSMLSLLRGMNVFDSVEYFLDRIDEDWGRSDFTAVRSHMQSVFRGLDACRTYVECLKEVRFYALLLDKEPLANQLLEEERKGRRKMKELKRRIRKLENR